MAATWNMQYFVDNHLLHIKTYGTYTVEDSRRMTDEIARMNLHPEHAGILIDHRATDINLSLSEIYRIPESYPKIAQASMFTIAIVFSQIGLDERFYEAVCHDKGYPRIKIFSDYHQAMSWMAHANTNTNTNTNTNANTNANANANVW